MGVAASFTSLVAAGQARQWLIQHGIDARVVGEIDALGGVGISGRGGRYGVLVDEALEPAARGLLRDWRMEPAPEDLEAQAIPDLSRLDPQTRAPCPSCSAPLPLDAAVSRCPACGAQASPVDVLLARYGPELLAACYADTAEPLPDKVIDTLDLRCPTCNYALGGLPRAGVCPECDEPYSKQQVVETRGLREA